MVSTQRSSLSSSKSALFLGGGRVKSLFCLQNEDSVLLWVAETHNYFLPVMRRMLGRKLLLSFILW